MKIKHKLPESLHAGDIVIAKPFWNDEIYKRSVVILIGHGRKGSTGIIVNKQSNLSVYDALPELEHRSPLYFGGPIRKKTISYLHSNPNLPDSYYLGNDLFWGGNYDFLRGMHESGKINLNNFHFCAGFVKWDRNELESELKEQKWWVSKLTYQELFQIDPHELWGDKLTAEQHVYGLLSPYPDPSFS